MSWTVRAELEAVAADFIYGACLGVRVVSVRPTTEPGAEIAVHRFEPWMLRAMQARYDFPVQCRQQTSVTGLVAAA
ncbi:MAG: hypothetical protein QOK35_730 [Pseudonocardiales bacterium]|nr:hypothetical protein [Pseudonocardiales bacterium]